MVEHVPSRAADSQSANHKILPSLMAPNVHYHLQNILPLDSILHHTKLVHILTASFSISSLLSSFHASLSFRFYNECLIFDISDLQECNKCKCSNLLYYFSIEIVVCPCYPFQSISHQKPFTAPYKPTRPHSITIHSVRVL